MVLEKGNTRQNTIHLGVLVTGQGDEQAQVPQLTLRLLQHMGCCHGNLLPALLPPLFLPLESLHAMRFGSPAKHWYQQRVRSSTAKA